MNDMGTQMLIQRLARENGNTITEDLIKEVCEKLNEKDQRSERMGKWFREEQEIKVRAELQRK